MSPFPRRALLLGGVGGSTAAIVRPTLAAPTQPPPPVAAGRSVVAVVGGGPSARRALADASLPSGTGIAVGAGIVLTTASIAAAAAASRGGLAVLAVDPAGTATALSGRVVATDPRAGIALIAVDGDGDSPAALTPATFAPSSTLRVGQRVYAIAASPLDGAPALSGGILAGRDRALPLAGGVGALVGALQTDARVVEGGPLVDAAGAVVGVGVAPSLVNTNGPPASVLGFALPSDAVVAAVSKMRVPA